MCMPDEFCSGVLMSNLTKWDYLIIVALPSMLIQHLAYYLQNASIYVIFMQFTNLAKYKGINVQNLTQIKQTLNLYVLQNSFKKVPVSTGKKNYLFALLAFGRDTWKMFTVFQPVCLHTFGWTYFFQRYFKNTQKLPN